MSSKFFGHFFRNFLSRENFNLGQMNSLESFFQSIFIWKLPLLNTFVVEQHELDISNIHNILWILQINEKKKNIILVIQKFNFDFIFRKGNDLENARNNMNIKQTVHFYSNHFNLAQLRTDASIGPQIHFALLWKQKGEIISNTSFHNRKGSSNSWKLI